MIVREVCNKLALMVETKAGLPLYSSLRPGGIHAANGFHQVAGSQMDTKYDGGHDSFNGSTMKDLCSGKEWRKLFTVWKLLVLVVIGGSGTYMCMVGVGLSPTRHFPYETEEDVVVRDWRREDASCAAKRYGYSSSADFAEHYPLPRTYQRNECTCTPVHYFVILSMQRSGSGWFETLLNNHPNISSHGEIFSVRERRDNFSSIAMNLDMVYNLDWFNSASKNECTAAVGFKWMLNQGPVEYRQEVLDYFQSMGVSIILLRRRNVLKRLISIMANDFDRREKLLNGTHKAHVHSLEEASKLAEYKPIIDVQSLPETLQEVEDTSTAAQLFFKSIRMKVVYYEDLIMNPEHMTGIQEFLGVPPRKLESQQVKIHTRPLRKQIQNWDDVQARLKGTKYEVLAQDNDYT